MNTADGVIDGTSEKFSNDGSVEWKTPLMMAREAPLIRDGKLIFGGEQRRDQDICL